MAFVKINCPDCNKEIQIPNDLIVTNCVYCNIEIDVKKTLSTYKNPEIACLLNLAEVAERGSNNQQAYDYASKVIELESNNYIAWKIKAKSTCWLSTLAAPRYTEGVICASESIKYAPESEKSILADTLLIEISLSIFAMYNKTVEVFLIGAPNNYQHAQTYLNSLLIPWINLLHLECITKDGYRKLMGFMRIWYKKEEIEPFYSFRQSIIKSLSDVATQSIKNYTEIQEFKNSFPTRAKNSGCYIATAIYGSYDCPQVWVLRRFRDYILKKSWYGKKTIHFYYVISPFIVKYFGHTQWFNNTGKYCLDWFIYKLQKQGMKSIPYQDID